MLPRSDEQRQYAIVAAGLLSLVLGATVFREPIASPKPGSKKA